MPDWADSRFTGLFVQRLEVPLRPHDPAVFLFAGEIPGWLPGEPRLGCSGAGWTRAAADSACQGEGIERLMARPLPVDGTVLASFQQWPQAERAIDPARFVLFHPAQYASAGFPLKPLTAETECRWTCCRHALTGEAVWVPEELVYLLPRPGDSQRHCFGFSTGLSCGITSDPVLLRGVQEVIERDALVGAWWGSYPVEEWSAREIAEGLEPSVWHRLDRPNLCWRFYRVETPFSSHVTLVTLAGDDREGWVFSVGSACRETRAASWEKSILEAVQGRHCVRRLLAEWQADDRPELETPTKFFDHALYYALHRDRLTETILERGRAPDRRNDATSVEDLKLLAERLGPDRPPLFRMLTAPALVQQQADWLVLRVVIPGLQPLHGDHRFPFLGGPLWGQRPVSEWSRILPHPLA